jgi:hypothetical protein
MNNLDFDNLVQAATDLQKSDSQAVPDPVDLDQFSRMHNGWLAVGGDTNTYWLSKTSPQEEAHADEGIKWGAGLKLPLAYWTVYDSQLPGNMKEKLGAFLPSPASYTGDQLVMATDTWLSPQTQLIPGAGKAHYL